MALEFFPLQAVANGEFGGSTSSSNTEMDKSLSTCQDPYDPLAVVGFALKFPQEASSVEGFWKMLLEKRCAMTEWPEDRVNVDAFYHPDNSRRGTIVFRGGHFLEQDPSCFDASFFSITAAEAEAMDPQHRMLLETTYHALENAGMPLDEVSGSRASVHVGCFTDDYNTTVLQDAENLPAHACTGLAASMLSNRISWFFNLTGPSMTLDTACSSSMTAFDLACQGLHNRDADMAIVAGASLALGLELSMSLSRMGFLSKDSKCYSFDSRGNGYGRGEGFGVLVIKRLSDALLSNDVIRAVVRATGSNQDGRTPGITQPSLTAQERLIKETYRKAALDMGITRFVEAHGTGTLIGDPIEASAIGNAFREHRSLAEPMYIGAVKSNIGHLEGTSGLAGIIKAIMILEKGLIPPNSNFELTNPSIDTELLRIKFPTESVPWPTRGLRRASISSFGFGGSNTHVVLDDAFNFLRLRGLEGRHWTSPEPLPLLSTEGYHKSSLSSFTVEVKQRRYGEPRNFASPKLLVWSAADEGGLSRLAPLYDSYLSERASLHQEDLEVFLQSLAYTLSNRRHHLNWRSFAVLTSASDLSHIASSFSKPLRTTANPKLAYLFTGQGAQYAGMAQDLMRYPLFYASLKRSEMYFNQFGSSWSLKTELSKPEALSLINRAEYSQPICTAIQIALVDLLRSLKIEPSVVLGHSSGEIAAAYTVGSLSHRSACKVAFFRGVCASELEASDNVHGTMMSVGLSSDEVEPYLSRLLDDFQELDVVVACINSPRNVTISGGAAQIKRLESLLNADEVFARKLQVSVAYHSPYMERVASRYLSLLGDLELGCPNQHTSMVSSVTGSQVSLEELGNAEYWTRNLTSPVRFTDALIQACCSRKSGKKAFKSSGKASVNGIVEVGPHGALKRPVQDTLKHAQAQSVTYIAALDRPISAELAFLNAAGNLHCLGLPVDISALNQNTMTLGHELMTLPDLPYYPFNHSRKYWHESRRHREGFRLRKSAKHGLLGTPATSWSPLQALWTNSIRTLDQQWIQDHQVNDTVIYPAAGMISMALEACKQLANPERSISGYAIEDTTFVNALVIPPGSQGVATELDVRPLRASVSRDSGIWDFRLRMDVKGTWQEVCYGQLRVKYTLAANDVDGGEESRLVEAQHRRTIEEAFCRCDKYIGQEHFYGYFEALGFKYGPAFQGVKQASYDGRNTGLAKVAVYQWPAHEYPEPHIIHPATLDSILQTGLITLSNGTNRNMPPVIPSRLGRLWIKETGIAYSSVESVTVCEQASFTSKRKTNSNVLVSDDNNGEVLMCIENFEGTAIGSENNADLPSQPNKDLCYSMLWKPDIDLLNENALEQLCGTSEPHRLRDDFFRGIVYALLAFLSDVTGALASENCKETQPHLKHYIQWMTHQLESFRQGLLPPFSEDSPTWMKLTTDSRYREELHTHLETTAQGKFFLKIGRNLLPMLKGELDPLEFLFKDDSVSEFYNELNQEVISYKPLFTYLGLLKHKNPQLRILETGAGMGASTDYILQALSTDSSGNHNNKLLNCKQYDYTDISPAFFETAKGKYSHFGEKIKFSVLDISKDPSQQGYEAGSYDVVIAASVLHATKNLEVTMRNVRKLLKPGGKLILFEVVYDAIRASFAFGLLSGWWLSEEEERAQGPWVTSKTWNGLMRRTGFSGVDLEIKDYQDDACHEYSILISTATERVQSASSIKQNFSAPLMIITTDSPLQSMIANEVGHELVSRGCLDEAPVISVETALASDDLEQRFVIFLGELDQPFLAKLDSKTFKDLQCLLIRAQGLLWVTNGGGEGGNDPRSHIIDGLARACCTENTKKKLVTLALENVLQNSGNVVDQVLTVFEKAVTQSADDFEPEYLERGGTLHISRVVACPSVNQEIQERLSESRTVVQKFSECPPVTLAVGVPGLLDTLGFVEDLTVNEPLATDEIEIKVAYTGVNFRDCLTVLGQVDTDFIGCECAGTVSRTGLNNNSSFKVGDRVAGLFINSYSTYCRGRAQCAVKVPDNLSLSEVGGALAIFATAWYALDDIARVQPGESVLIHAGAGGTGQAAIQVAKYLGAEVYATVGAGEKKSFVAATYSIPAENIFYSRNTSFAQGIMRKTEGRGVDVILNSLSGEHLIASWECIAPCGRFIEIGKRDIISHGQLPMWQFRKNCSFSAIDLFVLMSERLDILQRSFEAVMKLLADRTFSPPHPLKVIGVSEVEVGFRLLQSGKFFGKMVVEMRENDLIQTTLKKKEEYLFDEKSTYVVAGGLGGLGRSIVRWMVLRGAKFLILLSRSGARTDAAVKTVNELRLAGAHIETPACDISDAASLSAMLKDCATRTPPVRGCIQASMVLRDGIFENFSFEDWAAALKPKVQGSWNLHSLLPQGMDFFITLSSLTAIIGNAGQANYAAGNTYMDQLARYRVAIGEKAATINLGWMETEGFVAENAGLLAFYAANEYMCGVSIQELHALLDYYCNPARIVLESPAHAQIITGLSTPEQQQSGKQGGGRDMPWTRKRTFRHLLAARSSATSGGQGGGTGADEAHNNTISYGTIFREGQTAEERATAVTAGVVSKLSRALSMPLQELDPVGKPLHTYGVDSLLAVELRNYFAKEFNANVAVFDIMGAANLEAVGALVEGKSGIGIQRKTKNEDDA